VPSRRVSKVASALKVAISHVILHELSDPRRGFVTVTRVEPAADLKTARVYVSILGSDKERAITMHGLRHARGFVQGKIGTRLRMRATPVLEFVEDDAIKKSMEISRLLKEIEEE